MIETDEIKTKGKVIEYIEDFKLLKEIANRTLTHKYYLLQIENPPDEEPLQKALTNVNPKHVFICRKHGPSNLVVILTLTASSKADSRSYFLTPEEVYKKLVEEAKLYISHLKSGSISTFRKEHSHTPISSNVMLMKRKPNIRDFQEFPKSDLHEISISKSQPETVSNISEISQYSDSNLQSISEKLMTDKFTQPIPVSAPNFQHQYAAESNSQLQAKILSLQEKLTNSVSRQEELVDKYNCAINDKDDLFRKNQQLNAKLEEYKEELEEYKRRTTDYKKSYEHYKKKFEKQILINQGTNQMASKAAAAGKEVGTGMITGQKR